MIEETTKEPELYARSCSCGIRGCLEDRTNRIQNFSYHGPKCGIRSGREKLSSSGNRHRQFTKTHVSFVYVVPEGGHGGGGGKMFSGDVDIGEGQEVKEVVG